MQIAQKSNRKKAVAVPVWCPGVAGGRKGIGVSAQPENHGRGNTPPKEKFKNEEIRR